MIERCLAKDPSQRPTADGLLAEVGALQPTANWLPESIIRAFARDAQAGPAPATAAAPAPAPGSLRRSGPPRRSRSAAALGSARRVGDADHGARSRGVCRYRGRPDPGRPRRPSADRHRGEPAADSGGPPPPGGAYPQPSPDERNRPRRRLWRPMVLVWIIVGMIAAGVAGFAVTSFVGGSTPTPTPSPAGLTSSAPGSTSGGRGGAPGVSGSASSSSAAAPSASSSASAASSSSQGTTQSASASASARASQSASRPRVPRSSPSPSPTSAPPTSKAPTPTPTPTTAPPTSAPPTSAPPTSAPPTSAPADLRTADSRHPRLRHLQLRHLQLRHRPHPRLASTASCIGTRVCVAAPGERGRYQPATGKMRGAGTDHLNDPMPMSIPVRSHYRGPVECDVRGFSMTWGAAW